MLIVMTAHL